MKIEEKIEQIRDEMNEISDVLMRYSFLVEISAYLTNPDPLLLTDKYLYPNCQSKVWIGYTFKEGRLRIDAFSDTLIIRGILYVLTELYDGCTAEEIALTDVDIIKLCGVQDQFGSERSGNIRKIQEDIKKFARQELNI